MGIYRENNWLVNDIFTLPANFVSQELNGLFDLTEVSEFLVWYLIELGPWLNIFWRMVKTELKRTSCHDTITSRQKIESNN